jgi:hypothetical protein
VRLQLAPSFRDAVTLSDRRRILADLAIVGRLPIDALRDRDTDPEKDALHHVGLRGIDPALRGIDAGALVARRRQKEHAQLRVRRRVVEHSFVRVGRGELGVVLGDRE